MVNQGDILEIQNVNYKILVISKNILNKNELIIGCPISNDKDIEENAIHIKNSSKFGLVLCEYVTHFDIEKRLYKKVGEIKYTELQEITDTVQSLIDYI